jgi:BolA family transcriptional regulator, general stress-responsive regulator
MMIEKDRIKTIEDRLTLALQPSHLNIRDDSAAHAGHQSAKASGGGHFTVTVVSELFSGKTLIQRHKMVYQALEGMIGPDIHAIQINAKTASEFKE